ncbi:hypothetical protein [Piscirickettsia litoralis]|uniref:HTH cro/C1-type domain-containing protein n=1 Tax=Piscirickettsia litoralis TaxID=1891921 RepID=A0ABX2ZXP2_9GAMM|nr:hypothetical protein [Piscirickettsia litoralis]ODN41342.1 hypothetical protein BGC07_16355 [Piscirickettsia litoralis]
MHESKEELIERGIRLSFAIKMSRLNRQEFSKESKIPINTLRTWEKPNRENVGLKSKSADKVIAALFDVGVICTKQWLLYGIGVTPMLTSTAKSLIDLPLNNTMPKVVDESQNDEETEIIREIQFFKQNSNGNIIVIIQDDSMLPFYSSFDYVGGKLRESNIDQYIGRNCIIKIEGQESYIISRFKKHGDKYILYNTNVDSVASVNIYKDVKITALAEITFHRKRELQG